jgi:hypothetical protein
LTRRSVCGGGKMTTAIHRQRRATGSVAEVPWTLFVIFLLIAFPLINLISLSIAYGAVWYISFQCAQTASTQTDFGSSLASMLKKSDEINVGGLAQMLKLSPVDGYQACGTDLFVESVDYMDATKSQTFGPNKALAPPIDLTNRFYEISAATAYQVRPFIDLAAIPFISSVPGLGSPVTLNVRVKRCAEFPQGLVRGPVESAPPTNAMQPQPAMAASFSGLPFAAADTQEPWNRPGIYDEIQAAGLTVVEHVVVLVKADNSKWTDTGVTVNPLQTVWLDFRADGAWSALGQSNLTADGEQIMDQNTPVKNFNLMGAIAPQNSSITNSAANSSIRADTTFVVGSTMYRFRPSKSGRLTLGLNDFTGISAADQEPGGKPYPIALSDLYGFNKGAMTVRIIVTQ